MIFRSPPSRLFLLLAASRKKGRRPESGGREGQVNAQHGFPLLVVILWMTASQVNRRCSPNVRPPSIHSLLYDSSANRFVTSPA